MTYRLQDSSRLGRLGLAVAVVTVASFVAEAPANEIPQDLTLNEWAYQVWDAGIDGDKTQMQKLIKLPPSSITSPESAKAYLESLKSWNKTCSSSSKIMREAQEESLELLDKAIEEGHLTDALKHAVAYQELLQKFDLALEHESVRRAVQLADQAIGDLIEDNDLMEAQELLYRLKVAYEDTTHVDIYKTYNERYEEIASQLQILRRYDPEDFHALYTKRAEARGDDQSKIRAFNPSLAGRWEQEVSGVRVDMLRSILDTAAREHIDSGGWLPLMQGGLLSLESLATTPLIDDTLVGLSDKDKVDEWIQGLGMVREALASNELNGVNHRELCRVVIDEVATLNAQTVKLPNEVLWREFGDGAMEELDRFSEVIWPYDIEDFDRQMQGEFIGVGVYIEESELGEIKIISPLEGKPAALAGIRSGDIIVSVNGVSTTGWSLRDAVKQITGPASTTVTLGVQREGDDEIGQYTITRDRIRMHTVKGWELDGVDQEGNPDWDWFIDSDRRIGYIRMTGFDQQTYGDILQAASDMQEEAGMPSGLILDLRHNPGGLLETAVNVCNLFMEQGRIVSGEDRFGEASFHATARKRRAYLSGIPVVVLINNGSASASEIVAGCLQAHEAAIVVGARSFGKGSVQTVHPVTDNAKLKLATQYYRLPSSDGISPGRMVHKVPGRAEWGVEPDINVAMTPEQIIKSIEIQRDSELQNPPTDWNESESGPWKAPEITRLLSDGVDPQLHTALVILQAKVYGEQSNMASSR
jgi:carboxyl-terminal processing protease